ncbi:MAG: hypothetical protein GY722_05555, partial [bacterium]|nr:hypothetical protein [bacterium]
AEQRAAETIAIAERNNWLLPIALGHLTLGRVWLYRAILERPDTLAPAAFTFSDSASEIEQAVVGLRRAGTIHHIPRSLLTRAWLRALAGDVGGARRDLDEAWEIAERGPMPLFQADVHLHRARLFRDRAALVEARRLIEKHGYGRRVEELADAEAAAKGW